MIDSGQLHQDEHHDHRRWPRTVAPPLSSVLVVDDEKRAHLAVERAAYLRLTDDARVRVEDWRGGDLSGTADRILEHAKSENAELIVLGRERNPLRVRLFGSTAERLACKGEAAVLLAKQQPARPYHRVLLATDFSEVSVAALEFAMRLLPRENVEFSVLHAYDTSYLLVLRQANTPLDRQLAYYDEIRARAEREMDEFLEPLKGTGVRVDPVLVAGDPQHELRQSAAQWRADLVVLGKGGAGETLLGSVASASMRRLGCDVLVVPPRAAKT